MSRWWAVFWLSWAGVAVPATASATQGERECSIAVGAAALTDAANPGGAALVGVAGQGQWMQHASDFWSMGGAIRAMGHPGGGIGGATLDARYTLDALTIIPSVAIGTGPALGWTAKSARVQLDARAEASVIWRSARDHGWVVRLAAERAVTSTDGGAPPVRWLLTLGYVHFHGKGIGIDL